MNDEYRRVQRMTVEQRDRIAELESLLALTQRLSAKHWRNLVKSKAENAKLREELDLRGIIMEADDA